MKRATKLKLVEASGHHPVRTKVTTFGFAYPRYRLHEINVCPGCNRRHWWVFRLTAQCAFCETALPIVTDGRLPEEAL